MIKTIAEKVAKITRKFFLNVRCKNCQKKKNISLCPNKGIYEGIDNLDQEILKRRLWLYRHIKWIDPLRH